MAEASTPLAQTSAPARPFVSVVIEGYNQSRDLGVADATLAALKAQDYPLDRVEVLLVGSTEQVEQWKTRFAPETRFNAMHFIPFEELRYYEFKNAGTKAANGDIIALTDSDVLPEPKWLSSIVENISAGADVSMGATLFNDGARCNPYGTLMRMSAAVTWAWILGKPELDTGLPRPRGFLDHNIAMRTDIWREFQYRTDLGRIIASPLLYRKLINAGKRIRLHPDQRTWHQFTWRYMLVGLLYRYGFEVHRLRRLDPEYSQRWMAKAGLFEPLLGYAWHVMLDVPKWIRLNRVLGAHPLYALALLPVFVPFSAFLRLFEMAGAYSTQFSPRRTQAWAENV